MKLVIPKKINIFGTVYKIKFVETTLFAGLCDSDLKTIFINIDQSDEQIRATYLHEIFHAMQFTLGMNNAISREMMEVLAENSATLVLQVLNVKK